MNKNVSSPRPTSARPLKRGKACLTCRFLKIKCDGARPICGPCSVHPKDDPCEYADGQGRSRTRVLEESVARLEARLKELEHPDLVTPSVTLHDPYAPFPPTIQIASSSALPSPDSYSPLSPFSATSTLSATSSPLPVKGSARLSDSPGPRSPVGDDEEPPLLVVKSLLENFFTHSSEFGFFLNVAHFTSAALLPVPIGHEMRPSAGLLRTVYLWGSHLSTSEAHNALEPRLLLQALRDVATNVVSDHPDRYLETIQAQVLLGYYFWRLGRCVEARGQIAGAASLALGCGFHRLRTNQEPDWDPPAYARASNCDIVLPDPQNAVEEGERINALWAVFALSRSLAATLEVTPSLLGAFDHPGLSIDTPWPLDMESYKENLVPPLGRGTLQNFWNYDGRFYQDDTGTSNLANYVKATILFHQAVQISMYYKPDMQQAETQSFTSGFQLVSHISDKLLPKLPPLSKLDPKSPSTRVIYHTHALVHGALIRLHRLFFTTDPSSRQHCLTAARHIARYPATHMKDLSVVNPIMGTLWFLACDVFIDEIERLHHLQGAWPADSQTTADAEKELLFDIHETQSLMSRCAVGSMMLRCDRQSAYQNTRSPCKHEDMSEALIFSSANDTQIPVMVYDGHDYTSGLRDEGLLWTLGSNGDENPGWLDNDTTMEHCNTFHGFKSYPTPPP